uniref:Uncharacterized protein n=1 Tax=Vespula pensylvanica TaxID=30213 RepID=A0A834PE95_VESPE|nr:hypothetical protein H0235_000599 [Vespula pensylvanica]
MIKVREKTEAKLLKLEIVSAGIEDGWVIRPTLVEYKAAGGLGSESRGQSEPGGSSGSDGDGDGDSDGDDGGGGDSDGSGKAAGVLRAYGEIDYNGKAITITYERRAQETRFCENLFQGKTT